MDWQLAITRNREALSVIIMALIRSLGLTEGGVLTTLPVMLYARALAILRPAESAVRRLIMIAAHDLSFGDSLLNSSKAVEGSAQWWLNLSKLSPKFRVPFFTLIDPLKKFGAEAPDFEIVDAGFHQPFDSGHEAANTRISAVHLGRRLLALKHALDTIPKQAKRLARWFAARDAALTQRQPHRLSPMRPGMPPGLPRRNRSEVQEVLRECHLLAIYAGERRDSS